MRHRGGLSAAEREARSRLCKLVNQGDGFVHGSWIAMARCCGHPGCKCATQGAKHVSHYVGQTRQRRTRMKAVPKTNESRVHHWIENYQQARHLLEQISDEGWQRITTAKENGPF